MSGFAGAGASRRVLAALALAAVFGGASFAISSFAYRSLPRPRPLEELSYYPSGRHLRPATLGHAEAAADLAWLRAVQYYGEHRQTDNVFVRMDHVFDILTSLSPHFVPAYVFGGFALAQEGRDFPAAERLMLKGIEANPRSAPLFFELGFLYYVRPGGRDLKRAAECFEIASNLPDAPPQADRFAAYARENAGDLYVSYELWTHVYRTTTNPYVRDTAGRELSRIAQAIQSGRSEIAVRRMGAPGVVVEGPR